MTETQLMRLIKHELNTSGRCRLVRNNVGVDSEKGVRYGLVGSPDLWGPLPSGRLFGIEVKTPTGRIRPEQHQWWRAAGKWNVTGGVCRSVEGAWRALADAEAGKVWSELHDYQ